MACKQVNWKSLANNWNACKMKIRLPADCKTDCLPAPRSTLSEVLKVAASKHFGQAKGGCTIP